MEQTVEASRVVLFQKINNRSFEFSVFCITTDDKSLLLLLFQIDNSSLEQFDPDRRSSFLSNITTSIEHDRASANAPANDEHNSSSNSDDEDHFNDNSIASSIISMRETNSLMTAYNESVATPTIIESFNHSNTKEINPISSSNTSSQAEVPEDELFTSQENEQPRTTVKRKRPQNPSSLSSIATQNQSVRLASKQIRVT